MANPSQGGGTPAGAAGPGAGYPQWGTLSASNGGGLNTNTGEVIEVTNPIAKYWAEVSNVPFSLIWFTSKQAADAYAQARNPTAYKASQGVSQFKQAVANATTNPATKAISNPLSWSLQFGNTGGLLTRILKVVIGGVLLLSGVIRISGADKATLGVAGKAAMFA